MFWDTTTLRHQDTKNTSMFKQLTQKEEWLAKQIIDIAFLIHKELGPGLLERIYVQCFCYELSKREIAFQRQKGIPVNFKDLKIENGLFIDLIVDDLIIVEFKAQDLYHPVWMAQILSYLRFSQKRLGFIINFHVPIIKEGIKRYIL